MTLSPPHKRVIFISRAGEDRLLARKIEEILREAGYQTYMQDSDFGNASFMEGMAKGFEHVESQGCLIALLSESYLRKPHCIKEARYPLIDDPMNSKERLIVLRLDQCSPRDFLKDITYVDIGPVQFDQAELSRIVLGCVERSLGAAVSSADRPLATNADPRLERIILFLENEDEAEPERFFLIVLCSMYGLGALLIAFDYGLDAWNWLFGTTYYAIFYTSSVVPMLIVMSVLLFGGMYLQMRAMAKTIEDAHLSPSQLRMLRSEVANRNWRSKSLVSAVVSMATRNITTRRYY